MGGGREIFLSVENWNLCNFDIELWKEQIANLDTNQAEVDIWHPIEHVPGFDPHGASCSQPVRHGLQYFVQVFPGKSLEWLQNNREELEKEAGLPLSMAGVAAAVFYDLEFSSAQAEMMYLLLRLPGAAVHALEQESLGWNQYPFFKDGLKLKDIHADKSERTYG